MIEQWCVYMVKCSDGTLYTGVTNDLAKRLEAHNSGKGAKYTAARYPVKLVWSEAVENRSRALKREAELKTWTRTRKEALTEKEHHARLSY